MLPAASVSQIVIPRSAGMTMSSALATQNTLLSTGGAGNDWLVSGVVTIPLPSSRQQRRSDSFSSSGMGYCFIRSVRTVIYTDGGDDRVTDSGGSNTINAGDGNNQITTGGGNDVIICAGDDCHGRWWQQLDLHPRRQ